MPLFSSHAHMTTLGILLKSKIATIRTSSRIKPSATESADRHGDQVAHNCSPSN
jgi:hypothetical protein